MLLLYSSIYSCTAVCTSNVCSRCSAAPLCSHGSWRLKHTALRATLKLLLDFGSLMVDKPAGIGNASWPLWAFSLLCLAWEGGQPRRLTADSLVDSTPHLMCEKRQLDRVSTDGPIDLNLARSVQVIAPRFCCWRARTCERSSFVTTSHTSQHPCSALCDRQQQRQ